MIKSLLNLAFTKAITLSVICLDGDMFSAKRKIGDITYKSPVITYEDSKNDIILNDFINRNNAGIGDINLQFGGLYYSESLNSFGIGIKIEKKTVFNMIFDLTNKIHLYYILGFLISKSILVASNQNLKTAMCLTINEDDKELTKKADFLLQVFLKKFGAESILELEKNKNLTKTQVDQYIKENPVYLQELLEEIKGHWTDNPVS